MSDIDAMAVRIHQTAVDHGFWPETGRNLGEMLMLVATELAECLEENRNNKPRVYWKCKDCGYETDRVEDTRDPHIIPWSNKMFMAVLRVLGLHGSAAAALGRRSVYCDSRGPLKPEGELVEVADAIIRLLDTGHDMASKTRYMLSEVMVMKMAYNETREHMHGKAY